MIRNEAATGSRALMTTIKAAALQRVWKRRRSTTTRVSVRDRAATRAQFQQQRVIGDEPVLVFIRDRLNLLNRHLPARIDAEAVRPLDDLAHTDLAPALVHIEDGDTQKSLVGWSVGVAERKPERRHRLSPLNWVVCCGFLVIELSSVVVICIEPQRAESSCRSPLSRTDRRALHAWGYPRSCGELWFRTVAGVVGFIFAL